MSHCHPLTIFHTVFRINHTNPVDLPAIPFDWPNKPNYPWPPPQPRFVFTRITMLSIYEIATWMLCTPIGEVQCSSILLLFVLRLCLLAEFLFVCSVSMRWYQWYRIENELKMNFKVYQRTECINGLRTHSVDEIQYFWCRVRLSGVFTNNVPMIQRADSIEKYHANWMEMSHRDVFC